MSRSPLYTLLNTIDQRVNSGQRLTLALWFDARELNVDAWEPLGEFAERTWLRLMAVHRGGLFHVKAVAAWSEERSALWMGSGNLTNAGLHGNREAMLRIRPAKKRIKDLRGALGLLKGSAQRLDQVGQVADLADKLGARDHPAGSAALWANRFLCAGRYVRSPICPGSAETGARATRTLRSGKGRFEGWLRVVST
ncbi:MAG: hypothetical protein H6740_28600 [Alphaproteobacteria bacterium]|nr:hypothetical protein [Alphaproteobacteria bacterium]